jgi:hypothetical protein
VENEWRRETPTQVLNVDELLHGARTTKGEHYGLYFDFRNKRKIAAHSKVAVFVKIETTAKISYEEDNFVCYDVY